MRAIVVKEFGPPSVLKVAETTIPKPGPRELLVEIKAAGVNPVETYKRAGNYASKPKLPYTPGSECAGIVRELGSEVKDFEIGDRVWQSGSLTGTYAQYNVCSASKHAWKLSDKISFESGAGISISYRTAYRAVMQTGKAKYGETVFIHGASGSRTNVVFLYKLQKRIPLGGVGLAAIQIARANGMRVIGSAGTEMGIKLIKDTAHLIFLQKLKLEYVDIFFDPQADLYSGCHIAVNHRQEDKKAFLAQILEVTKAKGVLQSIDLWSILDNVCYHQPNLIIEMLANVNLNFDMAAIAKKGRIVVVGNRGTIDNVNCRLLMMKEVASVQGCMIAQSSENEMNEAISAIQSGLQSGTYNPIAGPSFPIEKSAEAHVEVIEHKSGSAGKVIIIPRDRPKL